MLWVLGAVVAFGVAKHLLESRHSHAMDLLVYRLGGTAFLDGQPLYDVVSPIGGYAFTYPPFAAIVLSPVAMFGWESTKLVWYALLVLSLTLLWRLSGSRSRTLVYSTAVLPLIVVASGVLEPIWQNFHMSQISLVLALLVVVDLAGSVPARWRGLLTGVTAAIKLTPLIFLVWLLWTRQWRAAGNLVAAFIGCGAIGAVVLPDASRTYWTELVHDSGRIGAVEFANNQSVMGVLARLGMDPASTTTTLVWLVAAALLALLGLTAAVAAQRQGELVLAVGIVGLLACLVSPVSWTHHWVWVVPVGVGLASRWGGQVALVWWLPFVAALHLRVPRRAEVELDWTPMDHVLGNSYVWWTVLLLVWIVWRTATPERPASPVTSEVTVPSEPAPCPTCVDSGRSSPVTVS